MCKNLQTVHLKIPIFCVTQCYPYLGPISHTVWSDALGILLLPPPNSLRRIYITLDYVKSPLNSLMPCCLAAIDVLDRTRVESAIERHLGSLEGVEVRFEAFAASSLHRQALSLEEAKRAITERYTQSRYGKLYSIKF